MEFIVLVANLLPLTPPNLRFLLFRLLMSQKTIIIRRKKTTHNSLRLKYHFPKIGSHHPFGYSGRDHNFPAR